MSHSLENFDRMMFKYGFKNPVSPDMQRLIIKSRRDNLKSILKKTGYYSAFFGFTLFIFYWLRAVGIKFTLINSKIVVGIVTVNVAASTIIGGHYVNKYVIEPQFARIAAEMDEQKAADIAGADQLEKTRKDAEKTRFDFGIEAFTDDPGSAKSVSSAISLNLGKLLGKERITRVTNERRNRVDRVIMGSVREFGKRRIITAKVVNVRSARVEFVFSEEVASDSDIDDACLRLSRKIADKVKAPNNL